MRGIPVRQWTCDKCGSSVSVPADTGPDGWRAVSAVVIREVRQADDEQFAADWCPTCVAVYLTPLEPRNGDPE